MLRSPRRLGFAFSALATTAASAGTVTGKLDLPPPPPHPEHPVKGFNDRLENTKKPVAEVNVAQYMLVVLEPEKSDAASPQVTWDLVGESFARPVIGVPVGAEVTIKNCQVCRARTLRAVEDPKLLPPGPINPTGPKTFKVSEPRIYTIGDADAPHLRGKLVVVASPHIANVEADGKFEISDVPAGSYKLRVFYKDNWIDRPDDTVTVDKKTDKLGSFKVPKDYPLKK
jgi:hypothetical protein